MMKMYSLIAAAGLFTPFAMSMLSQAAQMVA